MKPHVSRANRIRPLLAGKRSSKDSSRLASGPSSGVNRPCLSLVDRPGIGKSRLADELLKSLAQRATPLVGRCPSYGRDMTFWPLREMLAHAANGQLREALSDVLHDQPDRSSIADRILAAVGMEEAVWPTDETAWAFARLFRHWRTCDRISSFSRMPTGPIQASWT